MYSTPDGSFKYPAVRLMYFDMQVGVRTGFKRVVLWALALPRPVWKSTSRSLTAQRRPQLH